MATQSIHEPATRRRDRDQTVGRSGRQKPRLGPPRTVIKGSWGKALPAPGPDEMKESGFRTFLRHLFGPGIRADER